MSDEYSSSTSLTNIGQIVPEETATKKELSDLRSFQGATFVDLKCQNYRNTFYGIELKNMAEYFMSCCTIGTTQSEN